MGRARSRDVEEAAPNGNRPGFSVCKKQWVSVPDGRKFLVLLCVYV